VEWIHDAERFDALSSAWDALLPEDARPFDLHCWYSAWWKAFGGSSELAVCVNWRDAELQGVCPLILSEDRTVRAMAGSHSAVFRPLARNRAAMRELTASVVAAVPRSLDVWGLPSGDPAVAALEEAVARTKMLSVLELLHVSPVVETDGDFDAWRAGSKPRWGAPLERFRRKMARDHEAQFNIVEAPRDLAAELDAGFAVEASGWKGRAGTAIISMPETEQFYREVAHAMHERGELRLSRIVLDGKPVAFDLCVLHAGRLYLLKTGYDEGFRRLAPGLVMRLSTIERCFELGYQAHELLGSESEWKLKFATTERRHVGLRAYRRRPMAFGRYAYRSNVRPVLKRAYRAIRPPR
jgi:CelD/BcsL family acetyltransferase involved in cellulose biosynthesis